MTRLHPMAGTATCSGRGREWVGLESLDPPPTTQLSHDSLTHPHTAPASYRDAGHDPKYECAHP